MTPIRSVGRSVPARVLLLLVRLYQGGVSPLLGPRCRFLPSCSEYAADAVAEHGALRGSWLAVRRLLRCQPLCAGGWDPVPEARRRDRRAARPVRSTTAPGCCDPAVPAASGAYPC